jgi:hypothetical protein
MKFLVTAIIALDDSCMPSDSWWTWMVDHKDESDHDGGFFAHSRAEDSDDYIDKDYSQEEDVPDRDVDFLAHSRAEDSDDNSDNESNQDEEDEPDHDGDFFAHSSAEYSADNGEFFEHYGAEDSDVNSDSESGIYGAYSGAEESYESIQKSGDDNDDESYLNDHGSGPVDEDDGYTVRYDGDCGGMFGGDGMLCRLSNVRTMALSAHSGEV